MLDKRNVSLPVGEMEEDNAELVVETVVKVEVEVNPIMDYLNKMPEAIEYVAKSKAFEEAWNAYKTAYDDLSNLASRLTDSFDQASSDIKSELKYLVDLENWRQRNYKEVPIPIDPGTEGVDWEWFAPPLSWTKDQKRNVYAAADRIDAPKGTIPDGYKDCPKVKIRINKVA